MSSANGTGKLAQTSNLLALYLHQCGETEVPKVFNVWACLSAIAACVSDRVGLEKFKGKLLAPNLYVMLIGPSGLGKGEAIDTALKFLAENKRVNAFQGKATAPYLLDYLGRKQLEDGKKAVVNPKLYLVTPELAMSVGKGDWADAFLKLMTELYTAHSVVIREGTRTGGSVTIKDPCLNWLAGTTKEWLVDCVPRDMIAGGFFGRTVAVTAVYDLAKRIRRPQYPHDTDEVRDHVASRFYALSRVSGTFSMTSEAEAIEDRWYMQRPAPEDEALIPSWKREHDLTLKLAQILSLADGATFTISAHHMAQAQRLTALAMASMPRLISQASSTPDTFGMSYVKELIEKTGRVAHSALLRHVYQRGINAERLRSILDTLLQARLVARAPLTGKGIVYQWVGSRTMPAGVAAEVEAE
jgi:hypothetical protein